MRVTLFMMVLVLGSGCKKHQGSKPKKDPAVKFWSISSLKFNGEAVPLDACTLEDYLDVREDQIALSYHCEYSQLDSVPSYHIHKLNWEKRTDSTYGVFSDDRGMNGTMFIDLQQQLHLNLEKTGGRRMEAVFR